MNSLQRLSTILCLLSGSVVSYNYNANVWCNYNSDPGVCDNIQADLNKHVSDALDAVYAKYPVNSPETWVRYDQGSRRMLRTSQTLDQTKSAQRQLQRSPCPFAKCMGASPSNPQQIAQYCSQFCPTGRRRRDLDAEKDEENRDLQIVEDYISHEMSTQDFSVALEKKLKTASSQVYLTESSNPKASSDCKAILMTAVCDAVVTIIQ